ncbi:LOW QUALITY PROTEIN: hypothetical protein U9M48_036859, partial [Paspalum notatum var. saurae]
MSVNLEEGNDTFVWGLNKLGSFSVKSMYNSLINDGFIVSQEIWHLRIPLKIKIFLWFLKRGVLLTKDNLTKRNWNGRTNCEFCNQSESIQHFFFECHFTKFLWRVACSTIGLMPPRNIMNLFGSWSKQGGQNKVGMLLAGAAALCWAVWLTRNDILFNKCSIQGDPLALTLGSRNDDKKEEVVEACKSLESSAMELFFSFGWPFVFRIGF